jgi:hypothetical protein
MSSFNLSMVKDIFVSPDQTLMNLGGHPAHVTLQDGTQVSVTYREGRPHFVTAKDKSGKSLVILEGAIEGPDAKECSIEICDDDGKNCKVVKVACDKPLLERTANSKELKSTSFFATVKYIPMSVETLTKMDKLPPTLPLQNGAVLHLGSAPEKLWSATATNASGSKMLSYKMKLTFGPESRCFFVVHDTDTGSTYRYEIQCPKGV